MKNKNRKGFTLIELLVVVLIIGILAAIALPQYFKAVEKSRSAEALSLFGSIVGAQQRYFLVHDRYTTDFSSLDLDFTNSDGTPASGANLTTANFDITLQGTSGDLARVRAVRSGGRFPYELHKNYNSGIVYCGSVGGGANTEICSSLGNFGTLDDVVVDPD